MIGRRQRRRRPSGGSDTADRTTPDTMPERRLSRFTGSYQNRTGMKPLLSVDPGLTGTGWAYWETPERPSAVGVVKAPGNRHTEWYERAQTIAAHLEGLCTS